MEKPRSFVDGAFAVAVVEGVDVATDVLVGAKVPVPLAIVGYGVFPPSADAAIRIPLLVTAAALGIASLAKAAGGVGCGDDSAFRC